MPRSSARSAAFTLAALTALTAAPAHASPDFMAVPTCTLGTEALKTLTDPSLPTALVDAIYQGRTPQPYLRECVQLLALHGDIATQNAFYNALWERSVRDADNAPDAAALAASLLGQRAYGARLDQSDQRKYARKLKRRKDPAAEGLRALVEIEGGTFEGAPVGATAMKRADLSTLLAFAQRLPEADLRQMALRQLIEREVEAGSPWVQANADLVRAQLADQGWVSLPQDTPVQQGSFRGDAISLELYAKAAEGVVGVLPRNLANYPLTKVPLSGLAVSATGLDAPAPACAGRTYSAEPCLAPTRLSDAEHWLMSDETGLLLPVQMTIDDAIALLGRGRFQVALHADQAPISGLELRPWLSAAPSFNLAAPTGQRGPDIDVTFEQVSERLFKASVIDVQFRRNYTLLVSLDDQNFSVSSAGGQGFSGTSGAAGAAGAAGKDGEPGDCTNNGTDGEKGGAGGPGGPGGAGGNGGDGGTVTVNLICTTACEELRRYAGAHTRSIAGAPGSGGSGGYGGNGGAGGKGGKGASCQVEENGYTTTKYTSDGSDGPAGPRGPNGPNGAPGAQGRPGKVVIRAPR